MKAQMAPNSKLPVSLSDIYSAQTRIKPFVKKTPLLTSHRLDEIFGERLIFKCENFQSTGAFKVRGAHNAVLLLNEDQASNGVVTHSSGNHAAALSLAARNCGLRACIVMPSNAAKVKVESVRRLGAEIIFCDPTITAREEAASKIVKERGAALIHPYDNPSVIAGQGTAAAEFLEEAPDLEAVLAPVGGGGLMSGTAVAVKGVRPGTRILATEPERADDAYRSWRSGVLTPGDAPDTIADGLRTTLGGNAFVILRELLDDFATVSEVSIIEAMRLVWDVMKIVIEPSSAVPIAALLERKFQFNGGRVGVILTGGNVDLDRLPF